MKKINFGLLICFFILAISCHSHSSKKLPVPIRITEAYNNLELYKSIAETDSVAGVNNKKFKIDTTNQVLRLQNEHPLIMILQQNIDRDEHGQYRIAESSFLGLSQSQDTSKVIDYLSKSDFMPKDAKYYWTAYHTDEGQIMYQLYALKTKATSIDLNENDIDNIRIEDGLNIGGILGLTGKRFNMVSVYFKHSSLDKILKIFPTDTNVMIFLTINNKKIAVSMKSVNFERGVILGNMMADSFADSVSTNYSYLVHDNN